MIKQILKLKGLKLVLVTGKNSDKTAQFIYELVSDFKKVKLIERPGLGLKKISLLFTDVVVLSCQDEFIADLDGLFKNFKQVITVINSDNQSKEKDIIRKMKKEDMLLVDFKSREKLPGKRMTKFLSYGIDPDADFYVSDINTADKTNFKINYDGSSVPVWIGENSTKEDVLSATAGLGVGVLLGINFVNLTQKIKE